MRLGALVDVSESVAGTRSRIAKRELIADLLRRTPADELGITTSYLSGTLTQRRTGIGWRGLADLPPPAAASVRSLAEIDAALERISALAGPGSASARATAVAELFASLTASEQDYLRRLITGNVRQGALDSVMLDAIAEAAELPTKAVRHAAMFSAPTGPIAVAALTGGAEALAAFTLQVGRPVRPMLAASAPDVPAAVEKAGGGTLAIDTKLDGIRIQVHKDGADIRVFTRSLDEISERVPVVVEAVRGLAAERLILDGEALLIDDEGRPRPFQETASDSATLGGNAKVRPYFFDLLLDGDDALLELALRERLERLDARVPSELRIVRSVSADSEDLTGFYDHAVADGQEGVILKRLDAPYDAGRRGSAWVKVKPRHTLDLVVLAVEWGSGRRRGWLSNIHLGARDGDAHSDQHWVMLGKTFKGMTDEMLAWQTERFLELETGRDGHVVRVRPEQVVEIAFDGLQRSTRYPGGLALRFARVLRYRDDKTADEADTIDTVRSLGQMIVAAHTLVYSSDPVATRTFFRDVLRWPFVSDAASTSGDAAPDDAANWLIFGTGLSELGVHPLMPDDGRDRPRHVLSLVCDDIGATVTELAGRVATFRGDPEDRRYGIAVDVVVPGSDDIQIYEPRHTTAYDQPRG